MTTKSYDLISIGIGGHRRQSGGSGHINQVRTDCNWIGKVHIQYDNSGKHNGSNNERLPPHRERLQSHSYNLVATIKYLEKEWCHNVEVTYQRVKGHVDLLK
jgi:hypothetical protein